MLCSGQQILPNEANVAHAGAFEDQHEARQDDDEVGPREVDPDDGNDGAEARPLVRVGSAKALKKTCQCYCYTNYDFPFVYIVVLANIGGFSNREINRESFRRKTFPLSAF
jgi:hypothetical protein